MTAPTHILVYFTISNFLGIPITIPNIIVGLIGCFLPDISNPLSVIGRLFKNISFYISQKWGHRTITHSWLILAFISPPCILAHYLLDDITPLVLLLSISVHISTDMINTKGVQFLYPEKLIFVMPKDHNIRIETGSKREKRFALAISIVFILSLPFGIYGYNTIVRAVAGSHTAAVEEYKASIDKNEVFVTVKNGLNRVTQEPINNYTFKVVAIMPKKILLCEDENGNRITIGQVEEAIIDSKKISIKKGVSVHTTYTQITAEQGWEKIIEELQYPYSYIIGELTFSEKPHYINTPGIWDGIKISEYTVTFNYSDLRSVQKLTKYNITDGIVTVKKEYSTEGIVSPLQPQIEENNRYATFLVNTQREGITVREGQIINKGDIVATSTEIDKYKEDISGLRQKLFTVDAEESKASALQDRSLDTQRQIENLNKKIEIQKRIAEKSSGFFKEAESNRLKTLETEKAALLKEMEEIKRSLKEEREYINKRKESLKREIHAQIRAQEAKINSLLKTSPYSGKIVDIKQKSANVFEFKIMLNEKQHNT